MDEKPKETHKDISNILKEYFDWHIKRTEEVDKRIEWALWIYGCIMIAILISLVLIALAAN